MIKDNIEYFSNKSIREEEEPLFTLQQERLETLIKFHGITTVDELLSVINGTLKAVDGDELVIVSSDKKDHIGTWYKEI